MQYTNCSTSSLVSRGQSCFVTCKAGYATTRTLTTAKCNTTGQFINAGGTCSEYGWEWWFKARGQVGEQAEVPGQVPVQMQVPVQLMH